MNSILLSPGKSDTELAQHLKDSARVIHWPETEILDPESYAALDESLDSLFGYDWVVLKNSAGAARFSSRFLGRYEPAALDNLRVLAIGEVTTEQLSGAQIHVDLTINDFSSGAIFAALESYAGDRESLARLNFLVPSANVAQELFEEQLQEVGARVDKVIAYQTTLETQRLAQLKALIVGGGIICAVFTQPASFNELAQLFDTNDLARLLDGMAIVCRDRKTANAAACFGLRDAVFPEEPMDDSLVRFINRTLADAPTAG